MSLTWLFLIIDIETIVPSSPQNSTNIVCIFCLGIIFFSAAKMWTNLKSEFIQSSNNVPLTGTLPQVNSAISVITKKASGKGFHNVVGDITSLMTHTPPHHNICLISYRHWSADPHRSPSQQETDSIAHFQRCEIEGNCQCQSILKNSLLRSSAHLHTTHTHTHFEVRQMDRQSGLTFLEVYLHTS